MTKKQVYPVAVLSLLCATANVSNADLVAYWSLDEGAGLVAHDMVGGFDGQIIGGAWLTPGRMGAAAFQGSGANEINCGPGPSPTTQDLTLAWWMIDNHPSYGTIMDKSVTGSGYGYNILVRPSNEDSPLRFRIGGWQSYGGWGEECRLPLGAYRDGVWVHIVCTYDSVTDTASIYVNGELPANGPFNPKTGIAGPLGYCEGVNNVETPLFIRGGEENFDGTLDEVAIWDQALTAAEVMAVYTLGVTALEGDPSFPLEIAASGSDLSFAWESQAGMFYTLMSSFDLAADLSTWESVNVPGSVEVDGVFQIASTPPGNMHTIPRPGDATRYYRVQEFPLPPVTVFSDDLESGLGAWTMGSDGTPGSEWALGTPSNVGPLGTNSGVNCFGTVLDGNYGFTAEVWLRSPAIDLTGASAATLSYAEFKDIEISFDSGTVNILDAADDSFITELDSGIEGQSPQWDSASHQLPVEALGKVIKIEFRLFSDDITNLAGWYLDDVVVTTPAP
ncbi:MAG: LamG-like jellyroll fold domain-containing protein [Akkermansiaceae bacterium]